MTILIICTDIIIILPWQVSTIIIFIIIIIIIEHTVRYSTNLAC